MAAWGKQLGMDVLCCDPPRARKEGKEGFVELEEVARKADIITFHVPYKRNGDDATHHLCSEEFLSGLSRKPIIINSARGAVTDTKALIEASGNGIVGNLIIDCWENEPEISRELLSKAFIATPHIAGYSREGKIRATAMAVAEVCNYFGWKMPDMPESVASGAAKYITAAKIAASYNPIIDTDALREAPDNFELLRNKYALRAEVSE